MAIMTVKYTAAVHLASNLRIHPSEDQNALYARLMQRGYLWDSQQAVWVELADEPANPPTQLVSIRVWADKNSVEQVADDLVRAMQRHGLRLEKRSQVYLCRPPQQLEGRVYVVFARDSHE